jgi:tRNA pseudouridine55 synthase
MTRPSSGVLSVEKGAGVTSFQVVAHLRRLLRAPKVGHGGTLDPDATGVLPILIGEATKLMPYLTDLDKEYEATGCFGIVTDTLDASGTVLDRRPVPPLGARDVERVLGRFVGEIEQVPPMYSALHHEGERLHEIARRGEEVERRPRRVRVDAIVLESLALPDFTIHVRCGKGTYVRTLVADIGEALGCGAALARLVRTRVGPYRLAAAVPWLTLRDCRDGASLWPRLLPPDSALAGLPTVQLDAGQARAFLNGQSIPAGGQAIPAGAEGDMMVRVYGPDDLFLGVGRRRPGAVKPERILHADPARPRVLPA